MVQTKLLVVDDDIQFQEYLATVLASDFVVSFAGDKKTALNAFTDEQFDLCLVDFRLPDGTGHDVVREMKTRDIDVPVCMMTAYADKDVAIHAMNLGVNFFLEKPFGEKSLRESLQTVLNRMTKSHDVRLDTEQRCAFCGPDRVSLTSIEYRILEILLKNKNKQVSREHLQKEIWGQSLISKHTLDTHIYNLKKKSNRIKKNIRVVHGTGFIFESN